MSDLESRKLSHSRLGCGVALLWLFSGPMGSWLAAAEPARPLNVLFIAVDDLNHWVGHFGRNKQTITPNIDRLAERGVSFQNAYCAAPACNPSRTALMSGRRPSTSGVYRNPHDWRPAIPPERTLPSWFRQHGYYVAGAGKIYHGGFPRRSEWDDYFRKPNRGRKVSGRRGGVGALQFQQLEADDDVLADHHVVGWCIEQLQREHESPFFLACGIFRPHLPWNVPRKYFDMHPLQQIQLPPHTEADLDDLPEAAVKMARPQGDHRKVRKAGLWKELIQAYLASVTFADAQIGRLLDALDASPHAANTLVVLWGDHGWHLGEKQHWRKFALWEEATRAPLIWVAPGVTPRGGVCRRPVDFMCVYPTLVDLCGLPMPDHLEGRSVRPLLENPAAEWRHAAVTTHGFQNHAVRTERWRYIRYADGSEELYDHTADPYEWKNLAGQAAVAAVKSSLAAHLPAHNALPVASRDP